MLSADQPPVEAGHFAEEAVVDEPEAADHGEADRVGEEVVPLVPERVAELRRWRGRSGRCRCRTSSVIAIAKTPSLKATMRENSISFSVAPLRPSRSVHAGIIEAGRDGTVAATPLECSGPPA